MLQLNSYTASHSYKELTGVFVWLTYTGYVKFPDDGTPGDLRVTSLLVSTFLSPSLKKKRKKKSKTKHNNHKVSG